MPYTVAVSFDTFYQNINLSGDHRDTANRRRDDIVSTLKKKLHVIESFSSGSIPRYTALKDHADLDVMVALHYTKHIKGKKPSEVLQEVRDTLSEYRTNVRKNGQAVTLYYKTWPNVDIVPCSRVVNDDGVVTSYSIPDMNTEQWITSKPKNHTANMTSRAGTCGSNFRKSITMIKHWNRTHSSYLQSYHIEAMALRIFDSSMNDISWDIFKFFEEAANLVDGPLWYEGAFADDYLTYLTRSEAKKRLETARDKARSAWAKTYGHDNDHEGAIAIWRQIFGDKFPAYG
ncbi:SMODS domain-containing nucleotidyltransferase [Pseudomonas abyssi]|uniref:SMODS domain-containing nucleotidyltransferase n=1 Tax=Pseudomonas abyssi TaxID=170540 RepID=UPI003C7BB44C